jgi:hypothetical protein
VGSLTALHAEVFGPQDGYPIVLAHGIAWAIPVWVRRGCRVPWTGPASDS